MFAGYLTILATRVMCEEFSQCYDDVNICLWTEQTDDLGLTPSAAQTVCQERHSFLPRITNSNVQDKLAEFRSAAGNLLNDRGYWIDVTRGNDQRWHWVNGSLLASWSSLCLFSSILGISELHP